MKSLKNLAVLVVVLQWTLTCFSQDSTENIYKLILGREYETAEAICSKLLGENNNLPEIWYMHGMALQGMQKHTDALESYKQSLKDTLFTYRAKCRMSECFELLNDIPAAIGCYSSLLEEDSTDTHCMHQKGRLLMRINDYPDATYYYKKLLSSSPDNYIYNKNIGICYYNNKLESMAAFHLLKAWSNNKRDMSLPISIANAYARLKMPDRGLHILEEGLMQDSANIPILKTAGSIEFSMGKDEQAADYLKKAADYGDTSLFVNKYLGIAYFNLARYDESIPYLRKYYHYDSLNTEATYYLGLALSSWHYKEEGIKFLQKTVDLSYPEPAFIGTLYAAMAIAKADLNERDASIAYYKKAIELDPERSSYYLETAKLYDGKAKRAGDDSSLIKALEFYDVFLEIENKTLQRIMSERNLEEDQIIIPGMTYAKKRVREIREELFFKGKLEK